MDTSEALRKVRWDLEVSQVPSRDQLIQRILVYVEESDSVRDDILLFSPRVGGVIDWMLITTDWTVASLEDTLRCTGCCITVTPFLFLR